MKIVAYHGTDMSVAKNIVNDRFICKHNKEHWLGDGIYFYPDLSLARWWTSNPTSKFGVTVEEPAIIKCEIEIDEDRILNLSELSGFTKYIGLMNDFFGVALSDRRRPSEKIDYTKLRCAFFNYVFIRNEVDLIVAPFSTASQPYFPISKNKTLFEHMNIMYTEMQICLREDCQDVIIAKNIIGGECDD